MVRACDCHCLRKQLCPAKAWIPQALLLQQEHPTGAAQTDPSEQERRLSATRGNSHVRIQSEANACVHGLRGNHRPWIPAKPVKEVGVGCRKEKELDGARRAGVDSQPALQAGAGLNFFPLKRRAPFPERRRMAQSRRRLHAHLGC